MHLPGPYFSVLSWVAPAFQNRKGSNLFRKEECLGGLVLKLYLYYKKIVVTCVFICDGCGSKRQMDSVDGPKDIRRQPLILPLTFMCKALSFFV